MQDVNDNMEELLRRAAEGYPLKTDGSDWSKVAAGLQSSAEKDAIAGKKKYRQFLWLLLLLPLGWICNRYTGAGGSHDNTSVVNREVISKPVTAADKTNATTNKAAADRTDPVAETSKQSHKNSDVLSTPDNPISAGNQDRGINGNKANTTRKRSGAAGKSQKKNAVLPMLRAYAPTQTSKRNQQPDKNDQRLAGNTIPTGGSSHSDKPSLAKPLNAVDSARESALATTQMTIDTTAKQPAATVAKPNVDTKKNKIKKFYVGILGGPDVSTVKMQNIQSVGYTVGGIAGYRINKKWSIETGFFWDKKIYYTQGRYFDKTKTAIPNWVNIEKLFGECQMFEIPVNVNMVISEHKNHAWFASLGASSYIMKKEDYSYTYKRYGVPDMWSVSYDNSSKNWFSIANISAGYTRSINKWGQLRVAPYAQVPLSGAGIGNIRLTSFGLRLGLTKSIF